MLSACFTGSGSPLHHPESLPRGCGGQAWHLTPAECLVSSTAPLGDPLSLPHLNVDVRRALTSSDTTPPMGGPPTSQLAGDSGSHGLSRTRPVLIQDGPSKTPASVHSPRQPLTPRLTADTSHRGTCARTALTARPCPPPPAEVPGPRDLPPCHRQVHDPKRAMWQMCKGANFYPEMLWLSGLETTMR